MKNASTLTILVAGLAVAGLAFIGTAQVKQGKERPLKTAHLMKGVVKPNCKALGDALKAGPADDEAWEDIVMYAALLNEASFTLMADGRCPDATWAEAAKKTLGGCSAAVLKAADAKDLDAASKAFKAMTQSCKTCHDAHKEKE